MQQGSRRLPLPRNLRQKTPSPRGLFIQFPVAAIAIKIDATRTKKNLRRLIRSRQRLRQPPRPHNPAVADPLLPRRRPPSPSHRLPRQVDHRIKPAYIPRINSPRRVPSHTAVRPARPHQPHYVVPRSTPRSHQRTPNQPCRSTHQNPHVCTYLPITLPPSSQPRQRGSTRAPLSSLVLWGTEQIIRGRPSHSAPMKTTSATNIKRTERQSRLVISTFTQ